MESKMLEYRAKCKHFFFVFNMEGSVCKLEVALNHILCIY